MPIDSPIPHSVLMININQKSIRELMKNTLAQYNGIAYILDKDNNVVSYANTGSLSKMETSEIFTLNSDDQVYSRVIDDNIII